MSNPKQNAYGNFVNTIVNLKELPLADKIRILEYMADECYCQDYNLIYLECKQAIKELKINEQSNKS